jgi:predicted esterase
LALEFASRYAGRLGAVIGLSGGLIGDEVVGPARARHDGLPVFLGCSERDPHIPIGRVHQTAAIFKAHGALVTIRVYPGGSHGVNADEITEARALIDALA